MCNKHLEAAEIFRLLRVVEPDAFRPSPGVQTIQLRSGKPIHVLCLRDIRATLYLRYLLKDAQEQRLNRRSGTNDVAFVALNLFTELLRAADQSHPLSRTRVLPPVVHSVDGAFVIPAMQSARRRPRFPKTMQFERASSITSYTSSKVSYPTDIFSATSYPDQRSLLFLSFRRVLSLSHPHLLNALPRADTRPSYRILHTIDLLHSPSFRA